MSETQRETAEAAGGGEPAPGAAGEAPTPEPPPPRPRRRKLRLAGGAFGIALPALIVYNLAIGTTDGWKGAPGPVPPVSAATRLRIARAFAPRLRFNAWVEDARGLQQNRNEDYLPLGVADFFGQVESGRVRLIVQESRRAEPAVSEVRQVQTDLRYGRHAMSGFPERIAGAAPGEAPVYVQVYEDPARRAVGEDGAGQIVVYVEYWLFYGYDRAEARILGMGPFGSHRGDWEHTVARVRVRLGPGGAFAGGELERCFYYAHGHSVEAALEDVERVDDAGRADPAGAHHVVYVAQGKHASYPQAGEMHGHGLPRWVAGHSDIFRGNGVVIDTWRGRLVDLEDEAGARAELAPPEHAAVASRSDPAAPLADWTRFGGRWGPEYTGVRFPLLGRVSIKSSPIGPKAKPDYGDFGGGADVPRWADVKRGAHFRIYADAGVSFRPVEPPPVPVRR